MRITCPSCSTALKVTEKHYGKRVRCPGCHEPVAVPAAANDEDIFEAEEDSSRRSSKPAATRTCPMCGCENPIARKQCEECGEPLQGGDQHPEHRIYRDGKILVMHKKAQLPERCIKTNGPADRWLRRKLYWHHPAVYLALLANILIYAIIALIVRKTADIRVPICHHIARRRLYAIIFGWLFGLAAIVLPIVVLVGMESRPITWEIWLLPGGIITAIIIAVVCNNLASIVQPKKIDDRYVWLKGVHPDYLAQFPDWVEES